MSFATPRSMTPDDLDDLAEIDAAYDVERVLDVERDGDDADPLLTPWRPGWRELDEPRVVANRVEGDVEFAYRQVARGIEEGVALRLDADGLPVAAAVAVLDPAAGVLRLIDLRVDYDARREGYGTTTLYAVVAAAREREDVAAVVAEVGGEAAAMLGLLVKSGFAVVGLDAAGPTFRLRLDSA